MPDLRPAQDFAAEMERLEKRYLKAIVKPMKDTRGVLFEALMRDPAGLAPVARREFDALGKEVAAIAGQFAGPAEDAAGALAEEQFKLVASVSAQTPNFRQAQAGTADRRAEILTGFSQGSTAWLDALAAQFAVELARLRAADEEPAVIADRLLAEEIVTGRASVWRNGANMAALESQRGLWTVGVAVAGLFYRAGQSQTGEAWSRQAVAAVDERTTNCCLNVQGQIEGLDEPFKLTGTPRYADEMMASPFHGFCRTGVALYIQEFEGLGVTTDDMRGAATDELTAREDGSRKVIHPAHATSGRGSEG